MERELQLKKKKKIRKNSIIPPLLFAPYFFGIVRFGLYLYAPCALTDAYLLPSAMAVGIWIRGQL